MSEAGQTLKEGERIVAPTRRPDGTLRKPIRIRAGYVPQEEVAIYQSKGAMWKKEKEAQSLVPPGFDPAAAEKPKTKSAKRNERKKEKRQQELILEKLCKLQPKGLRLRGHVGIISFLVASVVGLFISVEDPPTRCLKVWSALEKNKNHGTVDGEEVATTGDASSATESPKSLTSQMNDLAVSEISAAATRSVSTADADAAEAADSGSSLSLVEKKIRALKKKIRQAEAQQQKVAPQDMNPEQLEKLAKLEGWRQELKLLESKNASS